MSLSWFSIIRLGLIQMALGAIVVLTTSTLNRLMVVELALPALLPGLLVALHYGIQITRPTWGYRSDTGASRTRWIILGMGILALGGVLAAAGVIALEQSFALGLTISILAYGLIGIGVGASGTSLLALLATGTEPRRRAAAATITWLMMIAGIAITAGIFAKRQSQPTPFRVALREIWGEREARLFTIFVFLSMTAYFMQELILEPYAGLLFNFTPGQSTSLSGAQNGGVFLGMLTVGIALTGLGIGNLRGWVISGCLASAASLIAIALLGTTGDAKLLNIATIALGFSNGMFAVAAIAAMMQLSSDATAFAAVFTFEAALFLAAATMASFVITRDTSMPAPGQLAPGE